MTSSLKQLDPFQLFEESPCYISVQGPDLKILQANRRFRKVFGDATGRYCWEAYKHRAGPCETCQVVKTFKDGQVHSSEEQTQSVSGGMIHMIVYTSPIKDPEGNIIAVIEMSTNITEVRMLQVKLASLGQLVASTAHSIKSIITGLEGGVYVVNSGFKRKSDEKVQKGWSMVERNIDRISQLALDMLYYSRDRHLKKEPFSMTEIINDLCELFQDKIRKKHIEFKTNLDSTLSEYNGDKKTIYSMLTNMLENAIDACVMDSDSGKKHEIEFITRATRNNIMIEVADNGMGMDRETQERIFDLFYSTKESSGTGLGLMVSHKAVKEHGGDIHVASSPGKGTRFIISLPLNPL
ncbi:nitrogen regulation protein NR(II) [Fibrobacterota bacterium]